MQRRTPRTRAVLLLAVAPVLSIASPVTAGITVQNIRAPQSTAAPSAAAITTSSTPVIALPLQSPPINGFQPFVTFGLTAEFDNDFISPPASGPPVGATRIPTPARYFIGTLDTGANAHVMSYADEYGANLLANAGFDGPNVQLIYGAGGPENSEEAVVSDGLGFYITGLGNTSVDAGGLAVSGTMVGTTNTPILSMTEENSVVPNIIGTPMFAYNQVRILNSQTKRLRVSGQTYQGPHIELHPQNTPNGPGYATVDLELLGPPPFGPSAEVAFVFDPFQTNWSKNPTGPAVWNSMYARVDLANNGNATNDEQFLFDTGAQVTVLSSGTANKLGISTNPDNPTPPDFTVEVLGVGGVITEAPGYFIDNLGLLTDLGTNTTWENVPVIVLKSLPDPRDGSGSIPGILGMNLFDDRDLIINSDFDFPTFSFTTSTIPARWDATTGGNWGDNSNWVRGVPWQPGDEANFTTATPAPQTINVDANDGLGPYAAGRIHFDSADRYTLSGPGSLRLEELVGNAAIQVSAGSHTIAVPLELASTTHLAVVPAASTLTINSDIISPNGSGVVKTGEGTAEVKNLRNVGNVDVQAGRMKVLEGAGSGAANTSSVATLSIAAGAHVDLTNNNLIIREGTLGTWNGGTYTGVQGLVRAGLNGGTWDGLGGIITSTADAADGVTTLAVALAGDVLHLAPGATALWSGQSVDGQSVLVMYTWAGDANLDGIVSGDDYTAIDFAIGIPGAADYINGDFNYDGIISGDDYTVIDFGIAAQGAPLLTTMAAPGAISSVPEPSACGFAGLMAALLLRRRRRCERS